MLLDVLRDVIKDNVMLFPFLFLAFLLLELLEHSSRHWNKTLLLQFQKLGPLLGSLLGCIPECGIPVLAVNLFCASLISPGTFLSILLSSSDEAILLFLRTQNCSTIIPKLLLFKCGIAMISGYLIDFFFPRFLSLSQKKFSEELTHTCSHQSHNVFLHAFQHACNLFCYLFFFSFLLNLLLEWIGFSKMSSLFFGGSILQPIITAFVGLIPSCASSVLLTELFLEGILSFPALISGLCAATGVSIIVLFKIDPEKQHALRVIGVLWMFSAIFGLLLAILGIH